MVRMYNPCYLTTMKRRIYFDTLQGLLAVHIISRTADLVTVKVTAKLAHSGFKTGEVFQARPWHIVHNLPRQRRVPVDLSQIPVTA